MAKLKVVDKDSGPKRTRRFVEVHWKTPDGKHDVDIYPGSCVIEKDDTGMTTIRYVQEDEEGIEFEAIVTYGYGEDRKVVEIFN